MAFPEDLSARPGRQEPSPRPSIESVRHGRAVATSPRLEEDESFMVQEQLARLKFVEQFLPIEGKEVLDLGSGAGYVLDYIQRTSRPAFAAGIDVDAQVVAFAKAQYPHLSFQVADAADPHFLFGRKFDVVFSFEVLEHVVDQTAHLQNMRSHLKPGGVAVVTTPNRDVFSQGASTSVHNPTHRHELQLGEFESLLRTVFGSATIHGQSFVSRKLQRLYERNTRILLKRREMRVRLERHLSRSNLGLRLFYRLEHLHDTFRAKHSPLRSVKWNDFAFSRDHLDRAIWFMGVAGNGD